jgi:hypothetical protein
MDVLTRSRTRTYLPEDVDFYTGQTRLAEQVGKAIETCGFVCQLFVPPGGWRLGIDEERSNDPYPNQLLAAFRIFYFMYCDYTPKVLMMLAADFQGGKTGVLQALTRLLLSNAERIKNRYGIAILTAMSDLSWLKQTKERLLAELEQQVYHLNTLKQLESVIHQQVEAHGCAKHMLFIDDESRVGSKSKHRKGDVLNLIKISSPFETWAERGIRYLFVDATDPACAMNIATLKQKGLATSVLLNLPPSYQSIQKLKDQGRLFPAWTLTKEEEVRKFHAQILEWYGDEALWHLIRMPPVYKGGYDRAYEYLQGIFGSTFDIYRWDSFERDIPDDASTSSHESCDTNYNTDINDKLCRPPQKPTLILIKNMFYAGKTLNDSYVGAMHDRKSQRDDVTGQSFAGRASGHGRSGRTRILTNLDGIDRHLNHWKEIMQWDDESGPAQIVPRTCLNRRMPHFEVVTPVGTNQLIARTTGEEISREENLLNRTVEQLPSKLKAEHMEEHGPFMTAQDAIRELNKYYKTSGFKPPGKKRVGDTGDYHVNSRLLSWYRRAYTEVTSAKDLKENHRLTLADYVTISKTFGCSSRKGQPYVLYPVYASKDADPSSVRWYLRFVKKEFTKFGKV